MKTIIPLALILVILFATNPNKEKHIASLQAHIEEQANDGRFLGGLFGKAGGALVEAMSGALDWRNYYLCSVLQSDDEVLTFGIAGQVFIVADEEE